MFQAKMAEPEEGMPLPVVETTPEVVAYYNKSSMVGVREAGYFILEGVLVCEKGKKEDLKKSFSQSVDEKLFGKKVT